MFKMFSNADPRDPTIPPIRTNLASLVLRAGLAAIFVYHGLDKVLGQNNEWGANWMSDVLGVSASSFAHISYIREVQLAVAWGELIGGAALALGLLTRMATLGLIIIQVAAAYFATAFQDFSMTKGGGPEYNFALLAVCVAVLFLGAGRWSLDRLIHWKSKIAPGQTRPTTPVAADLVSANQG